jgi:arylsulfatase A-like enzyme
MFVALIVLSIILIKVSAIYKSTSVDLPNILIIVMDTVRQDHLSCYGYPRETTPTLVNLAKESKVYYNAYSTSSWTNPAHASLFTGLYPITHKTTQKSWQMSHNLTSLAEVLRNKGFETFGIVENPMLGKHNNFNQGFSRYYSTWRKKMNGKGENVSFLLFKKCIQDHNEKKPFFIFINFIGPHSPYTSSQQFRDRFVSNPSIKCTSNLWRKYYVGKKYFSEDELQHLRELYDAEILYVDYLIGKIIDELKRTNLWQNTVFIVTSDHGENIGHHDHMDHVFSLYESTIKIPLIVHYPKLILPNSKDYDVAQLTDIFPTVLGIVEIDSEEYPSQGFNLLKNGLRKERPVFTEYYYPNQALKAFKLQDRRNPKLDKYKRTIRSITYDNKKLIWGSDGKYELYDFTADPFEKDNLIEKEIEVGQEMLSKLANLLDKYEIDNKYSDKTKILLDKETEEVLRTLGYLN